jgi:UDP-glucose:(heptosyl)LPS alpha-1,3-glucosyltransferase
MDIGLCYESVLPARGGCETYIGDLARRLARDGHSVHLFACRWDAAALPAATHYHRLVVPKGPRFLRPWRFAAACERALRESPCDVSVGFDKTWGQDILYPQGGLHAASAFHNRLKFRSPVVRRLAGVAKWLDPAAWSFARLERRQYLGPDRPLVVVNSRMVRGHFERFLGVAPERLRVVHSAIDPLRFAADDRLRRRQAERDGWGVAPDEPVGLFLATNSRLKGLAPLLRSLPLLPKERPWRLAVAGSPKTAGYERLARSLGAADRVRFLGHRADPKGCYFAADFLVHPTFYDPCSLVVLEALACGLPVVTTRYNGAGELLSPPADGLVVHDPHDAAELAGAVRRMLDSGYRSAAASAARQAASRWTFEQHYQQLLGLFREIAGRKRAKAA